MQLNVKYKRLVVVSSVSLLVGCANVNKEQAGTAIGAIVGAVVGKKVAGDRGMVLGAMAGGLMGNRIGAHLDEEDRKRLAMLEQNALDTGAGGSFVTNKTKAKITVEASPMTLDKRREFALSQSLKPYPLVVIDPVTVTAYVDTPIYNALNEGDKPKMVIQKGVPLRIAANVVNEDWAVVGDSNLGIGYVPRRYLDAGIAVRGRGAGETSATPRAAPRNSAPAPGSQRSTQIATAKPTPETPRSLSKEQYESEMAVLHAAYKPRGSGMATAPASVPVGTSPHQASQSGVQLVQASMECKTVTRKVEAGSEAPVTESVKYCKEPPKGWQTQTA